MATEQIIENLNSEIDRLTRARDLLIGNTSRKSNVVSIKRRRPMSPETKKKIGAMMRKRWAERHKKAA